MQSYVNTVDPQSPDLLGWEAGAQSLVDSAFFTSADGWYKDGEAFYFDYYNSYVIHPMLVQVLEVLSKRNASINGMRVR